MTQVRTITLYNALTGELGPVMTGTEEDLQEALQFTHIEGAFDSTKYKVNIQTNALEEITTSRKPLLFELRNKRNEMLDNLRWTIMPDSPLSETNKQEWLLYLKSLQSLLLGVTPETTDQVVWPTQPAFVYA